MGVSAEPQGVAPTNAAAAIRRRVVRGSMTVFVGMVAGTILTLVFNAMLARMVSHTTLGAYFLVFSMVMIATTIAQLGLDKTVVRFIAAARATGQLGRVRRTVAVVFAVGAAASLAIAVVLMLGLGHYLAVSVYDSQAVAGVIGLAAAWIVVNTLLSLTAETFRGFKQFWPATLYSGLAVDILLVVGFGALWIAGVRPTLAQAVGVTAVATGLALVAGVFALWRRVAPLAGEGTTGVWEVTAVSLPLLVTSLANFAVGTGIDLWVVGHFSSTSDVALYGAASRLVFFVATPLIVVSQVVPPIIAELHAKGERGQLERTLRSVSTVAGLPAALGARGVHRRRRLDHVAGVRPLFPPGRHGAHHPELRPARGGVHRLQRGDADDDRPPAHHDVHHARVRSVRADCRDPARAELRHHRRGGGDLRRADPPERAPARVRPHPGRDLDARPLLARPDPGAHPRMRKVLQALSDVVDAADRVVQRAIRGFVKVSDRRG